MEAQLIKTESALEMKRVFQAPVERVFRAWTDPEKMNRWLFPDPRMHAVCQVDLRVGGAYEIQMHSDESSPHVVNGVYKEIVPNKKLSFTWRWKGEGEEMESFVTLTFHSLSPADTELTLKHERFYNKEETESHAKGWIGCLEQLEAFLS